MADYPRGECSVKLLKWWGPPQGSISSKQTGWYESGTFAPTIDLTFAQQIGQSKGPGRYLMLAQSEPRWWREIVVNVVETYYEEARG